MANLKIVCVLLLFAFTAEAQNSSIKDKAKGSSNRRSTEGCVFGDCENGYGKKTYNNGDVYFGYWQNGRWHGWGQYYISENNDLFSGNFVEGKQQYLGAYFWDSGDFFVGLYKDGKRLKRGFYSWEDGSKEMRTDSFSYEETGCVLGDCDEGYGVYIWSNGDMHAGFWKGGVQHGFGAKYWASGDFFYGLYKNGDRLKRGLYAFESGTDSYRIEKFLFNETGCVSGNCQNGFGTYIWESGDVKTGFWKDGYSNGLNFMFWNDLDFFYGVYRDNERLSRGLYVYEDGSNDYRTQTIDFSTILKE